MKTSLVLSAAAIVAAFWSTPASADLLMYEPFNDSVTSAITSLTPTVGNPWAEAGTASTSAVHQIGSGNLTGPAGFPASVGNEGDLKNVDYTEYARSSLGGVYGANSTLYYSLLLNVPTTSGLTIAHSNANANNDGIIAFNNSTGVGANPNTWAGELTMRLGSVANTFNLGIRASTAVAGTTYWTGDLTPGTTHLVVASFTEGATPGSGGLSQIWLDPTSFGGAAPSADGSTVGTFSTSASNDHIESLIIGAGIAKGADPTDTDVDEIRVGTTWASVTSVPEPSTLVLAGFGALALVSLYRNHRR